jgi:hypothetical protein
MRRFVAGHWRRRALGAFLVGAVMVPASLAGPASADVLSVSGSASTLAVEGSLLGLPIVLTPTAQVVLPPTGGGPFEQITLPINVPGVLTTGVLIARTEGGNIGTHEGFATSFAEVADPDVLSTLAPLLGGASLLTADVISAECISNGDGSAGETTLASATLGTGTILDSNPAPNTTLDVAGIATIVLNEQIVTNIPGVETTIIVNAVHITVNVLELVTADIIISQATCGAFGPDVLIPPTTPPTTPPGGPATPIVAAPRLTG